MKLNSQICTTREQSEKLIALGLKKETADCNWKEDIVPVYLGNSYDMLIGRIGFQVKQGKFNKEYLEG